MRKSFGCWSWSGGRLGSFSMSRSFFFLDSWFELSRLLTVTGSVSSKSDKTSSTSALWLLLLHLHPNFEWIQSCSKPPCGWYHLLGVWSQHSQQWGHRALVLLRPAKAVWASMFPSKQTGTTAPWLGGSWSDWTVEDGNVLIVNWCSVCNVLLSCVHNYKCSCIVLFSNWKPCSFFVIWTC